MPLDYVSKPPPGPRTARSFWLLVAGCGVAGAVLMPGLGACFGADGVWGIYALPILLIAFFFVGYGWIDHPEQLIRFVLAVLVSWMGFGLSVILVGCVDAMSRVF